MEAEYAYQLWAVTTWVEDGKPQKSRVLRGIYTTEEKLKDSARSIFQEMLEDPENRYIHVYGQMTPVDTLFDYELDSIRLEYGLKCDRRKRGTGLFIANTCPV